MSLDGLDSILDGLKEESLSTRKPLLDYHGMNRDLMARLMPPNDISSPYLHIALTSYEAWWLEWRLRVHLHSYRAMSWAEMETVIGNIIRRIHKLAKE